MTFWFRTPLRTSELCGKRRETTFASPAATRENPKSNEILENSTDFRVFGPSFHEKQVFRTLDLEKSKIRPIFRFSRLFPNWTKYIDFCRLFVKLFDKSDQIV